MMTDILFSRSFMKQMPVVADCFPPCNHHWCKLKSYHCGPHKWPTLLQLMCSAHGHSRIQQHRMLHVKLTTQRADHAQHDRPFEATALHCQCSAVTQCSDCIMYAQSGRCQLGAVSLQACHLCTLASILCAVLYSVANW